MATFGWLLVSFVLSIVAGNILLAKIEMPNIHENRAAAFFMCFMLIFGLGTMLINLL